MPFGHRVKPSFMPSKCKKNPYGFNWNDFKPTNLQKLMNLEKKPDLFKRIMKTLNNAREKHLDINLYPSEQEDGLDLIEQEVKRVYPYLFVGDECEKRTYFVRRLTMSLHNNTRSRHRLNNKNTKPTDEQPNILDLTEESQSEPNEDDGFENQIEHRVPRPKALYKQTTGKDTSIPPFSEWVYDNPSQLRKPVGAFGGNFSSGFQIPAPPEYRHRTENSRVPSLTGSHFFMSQSSARSGAAFTNLTGGHFGGDTNADLDAGASSLERNEMRYDGQVPAIREATGRQLASLYKFLRSCQPPMHEYMQCFVDANCITEKILRHVSTWAPEQRERFLKKILQNGNDGALHYTVEVAILENQFETYFRPL